MKQIILLTLTLVFFSCQSNIDINEFQAEAWKSEKNNCKSYRIKGAELLVKNQEKLIGKSEKQFDLLLGKADRIQLDARLQKKLYFQLTSRDKNCPSPVDYSKMLILEFSSVNTLRFITIASSNLE